MNKTKTIAVDILYDIIGSFLYGIGFVALSEPFNLPPGGATGISMFINHYTGLPVSVLLFAVNVPILVLAYIVVGKRFAISTVKTVIIFTVILEICSRIIPTYSGDVLLAAIFGGVLEGAGLGLIFLRGSTTGGSDVLAKVLQVKFPHLSMGRLLLVIDVAVLVLTVFVYKSLASAMYAMISVFVITKVIDSMIYGIERGRLIMVISDKQEEVYTEISKQTDRGSTLLKGMGTYTRDDKDVLICAVSTQEFHTIKKLIYSIDPRAFVMSLETDEVLGEGFKPLESK